MMAPHPATDGNSGASTSQPESLAAPSPKLVVQPLAAASGATELRRGFDGNGDGVVESDEASTTSASSPTTQAPERSSEDSAVAPGQTTADKEAAQLETDAKIQDELDTLTDEKTYFLPINAVEQRRSRHVLMIGAVVIIILGLAQLDIALDAGFITVNHVHSLTHLFHK